MRITNFMKRSTVIEIVAALFILLFVYTGVKKIIAIEGLKFVMKDYPILEYLPKSFAWIVPITELSVATMLLIPRLKLIGLYFSLIMMLFFTLYVGYMMAFLPNMPCTCGGMLQQLTWSQHLVFNIFFTTLALIAIKFWKKNKMEGNVQLKRAETLV